MDNMAAQKNGLFYMIDKASSIKKTANILLMEVLKKAKKIS